MTRYRAILTIGIFAVACGPPATQASRTEAEPATQQTSTPDSYIPPEKRVRLEQKFCAETLDYLERNSKKPAPSECKRVIMRPTDQFGHGDNEGYLVTVIVGEARDKIDVGAVVTPSGEVRLRSLASSLDRGAIEQAEIDIRNIRSMVDAYYLKSEPNKLPDALDDLVEANLTTEVPTDPWRARYRYERESSTEYEVYSAGPDGEPGTMDDVRVE